MAIPPESTDELVAFFSPGDRDDGLASLVQRFHRSQAVLCRVFGGQTRQSGLAKAGFSLVTSIA